MRIIPAFKQAKFIADPDIIKVAEISISPMSCFDDIGDNFLETYHKWITSTKLNTIISLDQFTDLSFSQGTTESFDKFYIRNHNKRFRIWKGEYAYHKIMFEASNLSWMFLDDEPLSKNDAIIISIPFADSGNPYKYEETLQKAEELNIPVLVDCCYFGSCSGVYFDFSYKCITDVVFSLSKVFPVARHRIGMRYSKNIFDGLTAYKRDEYTNYLSQHIGLRFLQKFSPDYTTKLYKEKQETVCNFLKVDPSHVVQMATGNASHWEYLNRGGPHQRLCISDLLV